MSNEDLYIQHCPSCDCLFAISKTAEKAWRDSHKQFFCPNGHSLSWQDDTSDQKELKSLRVKIKDLETKLAAALEDVAKQTKRADELAAELEIWKPSEKSAE
jgi:hypothetical protein